MVAMGGRPMPAAPQERADIETLSAMMGGNLDEHHALLLLRKHSNNLEKAASALLEGDTGAEDPMYADLPGLEPINAPVAGPGPRTPPRKYSSARLLRVREQTSSDRRGQLQGRRRAS